MYVNQFRVHTLSIEIVRTKTATNSAAVNFSLQGNKIKKLHGLNFFPLCSALFLNNEYRLIPLPCLVI